MTSTVWMQAGFRFGDKGVHTSRSMMLKELALLFQECAEDAVYDNYVAAIIDRNCLGKRTAATRKISCRGLAELYGLDPSLLLFRALRRFWLAGGKGQPLLALLTAMARDPLLRVTSLSIIRMSPGEELVRQHMADVLYEIVEDRLNDSMIDRVIRNTSSTWTQSGHLKGRGCKIRQNVSPTPAVTAYALLLGYILGARGAGLFRTLWAKVLDVPVQELVSLTMIAKRLGFLDMSRSGGVIEISFARMLTSDERRLVYWNRKPFFTNNRKAPVGQKF